MAEPTSAKPDEKAAAVSVSSGQGGESQTRAPADAVAPEDQDRGGVAYWRERAGRLRTTPHHIAGALAHLPADATFSEDDVKQLVREFSQREERQL